MFDRCVYHWLIIGDYISEGRLYLLGENAILIFLRELYQPENIYNRIQSRSIQKPLNPIDKSQRLILWYALVGDRLVSAEMYRIMANILFWLLNLTVQKFP